MSLFTNQLPTRSRCQRCGLGGPFMIGLYRCDRPDLGGRRCGGVLLHYTPASVVFQKVSAPKVSVQEVKHESVRTLTAVSS